jgi:hypothetical protein
MTRPDDEAAEPAKGTEPGSSSSAAGAKAWFARWFPKQSFQWLLVTFGSISAALHAMFAAPWPRIILAMLALFGATKTVWQKEPDAPTVIPIDVDSLEDVDEGQGAKGTGDELGGVGTRLADAAVDAPDALADAADAADAQGTGDAGAQDAAGDAGPKRLQDPNALAGGLAGLAPPGKEVNVSMLLRLDHMRTHPLAPAIGPLLLKIEQWRPFFDGTGLDPMADIDAMFTYGPRFRETSRVTAVVIHNRDDALFGTILESVAKKLEATRIDDPDVSAWRATIDKAPRVLVQLPGGLIITPPDGEKQAIAIAKKLSEKKKSARALLPKGETDLLVGLYLRTPGNALPKRDGQEIPSDLSDAHVTLKKRKDGGLAGDADAKAKNPAQAKKDAEQITTYIEELVPGGPIGFFIRPYVKGYTVGADHDVVRAHHELDGDQVDAVGKFIAKRL